MSSQAQHNDRSDDASARLSPAGLARKQQMLASLQREVSARGRRRAVARAAIVAAPVLALALAAVVSARLMATPAHSVPSQRVAERVPTPSNPDSNVIAIGSASAEPNSGSLIASIPPDESRDVIPRARPIATSLIRAANPSADLLDRSRYQGNATIPTATDAQLAVGLRAAGRAAGVVRTPEGVLILPDQPTQPG